MGVFLPFVGMVIAVLAQSGNMIVTKKAMSEGLNKYILVVYNNLFSCLILLPFCIIKLRSEGHSLNCKTLCTFFLLSVVGCSGEISGYAGIEYSSPIMGTAMLNLIPAFAFLLAIVFRMEILNLRSLSTQAKIVGTLVSISGAFVVIFYKGPPLLHPPSSGLSINFLGHSEKLWWILGGFFLTANAVLGAAWYVMQAVILRKNPALVLLTFYFGFNAILSALFSLVMVEDTRAWKLHFDARLVAVIYSIFIHTLLRTSLTAWCLSRCGPLYVTMFKPLGIIFSVVMGFTFLGDVLCLGSLIGAVIIVSGFYAVMWGKAKELKLAEGRTVGNLASDSEKVPLLQNKMENV